MEYGYCHPGEGRYPGQAWIPALAGMTAGWGSRPSQPALCSRRRGLRLVERRLRARDHCGEGLRLADRQVGHYLAVEVDPGELYAVHELRIGQSVLARACIDALDP